MVGFIPEVLTILLTPILKYICKSNVIYVKYVKYDIYDMYGALTYTICMYVNMGVKRSVRTSGLQPTILNMFRAKNGNILFPDFSFVVFRISFFIF